MHIDAVREAAHLGDDARKAVGSNWYVASIHHGVGVLKLSAIGYYQRSQEEDVDGGPCIQGPTKRRTINW